MRVRSHSAVGIVVAVCAIAEVFSPAGNAQTPQSLSLLPPPDPMLGTWRFYEGAEFPGAKGELVTQADGTLSLAYDFTGGGNYVAAFCDLAKPVHVGRVSFRARKTAEARLTVRVTDSAGQTFQKSVIFAHDQWQRLSFDMRNWAMHFGGADDGTLRQPIASIGILVENEGLADPAGAVLLADVLMEAPAGDSAAAQGASGPGEYLVTGFGDTAGFGSGGALQNHVWTADFAQTGSVGLSHSISLFGSPVELALRVRGGTPGSTLSLHLGSHFQGFHRVVGTLDGGEQTFAIPAPPEGWEFGGGENDGKVRNPLRVVGLTWERGSAEGRPAQLELLELRCKTNIVPDAVLTIFATLHGDDPAQLTASCRGWNLLNRDVSGTLRAIVRDWDQHVISESESAWTLPANGTPVEYAIPVSVPETRNFAGVEFQFTANGVHDARSVATYTRPLDAAGDTALRPESPWGMGVYLYRYGDHALMDRVAAMAQAAGVKWSREEFSWAAMEPRLGEYDFSFYDVVVDTANRHGISVYGLLSYWSNWTQPYTEQGIDDFCRWAGAVVRRYKDRVHHWEIYNEPNIFFWQGPKELYPVLVQRCYAAIKEADPSAQVLAISTAGIDRKFIQKCLDANAPFDVLTIHPYRGVLLDANFMKELQLVKEQVGGRPVWITEMGWSTQVGGKDERAQAQLLARCYLSAIASGACENISWYDFRNDGEDPFYNESNFGVLRSDLTPKPAYRALATICQRLATGTPRLRDDFGEGILAFEMGESLALWAPINDGSVRIHARGEGLRIRNLMGETLEPKRDGTLYELELQAGAPVFLTGARVTIDGEPTIRAIEDVLQF
ncbi:MAG: beta-galactosidase [Candidatus Hydrogenedentes bacterium]|nr:beta-galactosidase [Candidatus Hydrogenedentota bacterium]